MRFTFLAIVAFAALAACGGSIVLAPSASVGHLAANHSANSGRVASSGPALLPSPSWWKCSHADRCTVGKFYQCDSGNNPGSKPLGTSYRGVPACGPNNDYEVRFGRKGSEPQLEWECVELGRVVKVVQDPPG